MLDPDNLSPSSMMVIDSSGYCSVTTFGRNKRTLHEGTYKTGMLKVLTVPVSSVKHHVTTPSP